MILLSIHNKIDYLETQIDSFKKNIINDFKHIIINNAADHDTELLIYKICKDKNIECIRNVPNSRDVSGALEQALNNLKNLIVDHDDKNIAVIESDIFCFKKTDLSNLILSFELAGIYQQRNDFDIEYLHPCFFITKNKDIFNSLNWGKLHDTDVGGQTSIALRRNNYSINWIEHTAFLDTEYESKLLKNYKKNYGIQIINSSFIHYNRGSGWYVSETENFHKEKFQWLLNFLNNPEIDYNHLKKIQTTFSHSFKYFNGTVGNYFKSKLNPLYGGDNK